MKKNILFKQITLAFVLGLLLSPGADVSGQNDANIRNFMNTPSDLEALDAAFDNVNGVAANPNGSPVTNNSINDFQFAVSRNFIPSDVSAYSGVDMVFPAFPGATINVVRRRSLRHSLVGEAG